MVVTDTPFPPGALEANRAGRLSDTQLQQLRSRARGSRKAELSAAGICLGIAALLLYGMAQGKGDLTTLLLACGFVAAAVGLAVWSIMGADGLTRDLRSPRVRMAEGAILKEAHSNTDSSARSGAIYYIIVDRQRCEVPKETYEAAPRAGYVRLYFLPKSHHVVNLEMLPDRPLPEGATPRGLMATAFKSWWKRDTTVEAETMASMATLQKVAEKEFGRGVTPPPAEDLDPRPLQEAILGTWSNMLLGFTFSPDGTVQTTIGNKRPAAGRWSVAPDGTLHADLMGRKADVQAWVAGDTLTLQFKKEGMVLHRDAG